MADATLSTLLNTLNIGVRDGSNISFSAAEKTRALQKAVHDPFVTKKVRDTSVITTANTDSYALPFTGSLLKLGLQVNTYGKPVTVDDWGVFDSVVYLPYVLPTGKKLVMIGSQKLSENDAIPDDRQEYVITLAKVELVRMLQANLATTFLTNDISLAELLRLESDLLQEAAMWRQTFRNEVTVEL
jgi:hypothetical protein